MQPRQAPVFVTLPAAWPAFREVAKALLQRHIEPAHVEWVTGEASLGSTQPLFGVTPWQQMPIVKPSPRVSKEFVELAQRVYHHRDERRGAYLYRVLWRLSHGERSLLAVHIDPDVAELVRMDAAVARCVHKMHAFVRFRKLDQGDGPLYVAWYEPDHPVLPLVAAFFAERFSDMRWVIMTPDASLEFDGQECKLTAGKTRAQAPTSDEMEELWRHYYRSIFNPARLMTRAMQSEMPKKYWHNLPEAVEIPALIADARLRTQNMVQSAHTEAAAAQVVSSDTVSELSRKAATCTACPLYAPATQTVFGKGPTRARIVLVGEQPGDEEDRAGEPFIGPAGQVLRRALRAAGIDIETVYLTNAVKHFGFEQRGKVRLHSRPKASNIRACRPWLIAELERIQPHAIVALGATASTSLFGLGIRIERDRGRVMKLPWAQVALVTYHPSAVLRAADPEHAAAIERHLIEDLRLAARSFDR
jgi:uracil-DNA glycosylase